MAQDRGYFKDEGIEVDTPRFQTLVDMVAPVGARQLDIAAGGLAAGLYNAIGRDVNLHIVADKGQTPSPEWDFQALMIRKDLIDSGKVRDYQDLKGLSLVTSGKGNSPEVTLATALSKGGVTLKDVHYTQMGFPDQVVDILVKNTTVKDPKVYAQMRPAGLDPDGKLDVASMQNDLDYYVKADEVTTRVDLPKQSTPRSRSTQ